MDPLVLGIIGAIFLGSMYLFYKINKARLEAEIYDPFGWNIDTRVELVCDNCGFKTAREFRRGDYVFGVTKDKCPCKCKKPKCKGQMRVHVIYFDKAKTKEELKWEKEEEKWR